MRSDAGHIMSLEGDMYDHDQETYQEKWIYSSLACLLVLAIALLASQAS
jgi:hypothetical protein